MSGLAPDDSLWLRERYHALFEAYRDPILLISRSGRILDFNRIFLDLLGYDQAEAASLDASLLFVRPSDHRELLRHLESERLTPDYRTQLRAKDGTQVECAISVAPCWIAAGGTVDAYQAIVRLRGSADNAQHTVHSLLRISGKLNSSLDVDSLLESLVTETLELTDAQSGCAGLRMGEGMYCEECIQTSRIVPLKYYWPPGVGWPGWLIVHRKSYWTNDALHDTVIVPSIRELLGVESGISTPMLDTSSEVIGFFEVHNKKGGAQFTESDVKNLMATAQIAAAAVQNALAYRRVRELSGQLLRQGDQERRRISRELHDATGQTLDILIANLTRLGMFASRLDAIGRQALSESLSLAQDCSRQIRTLSYLLHPPVLDELGLPAALRGYVEGFVRRSGIEVKLEIAPDIERLPSDAELALFRIVQESLTNIHRHSGTSVGAIRLFRHTSEVLLEINDRGRGVPHDVVSGGREHNASLGVGIAGMKERVRQLRGRFEINSNDQGTTIRAILPIGRAGETV